MNGDDRLNLVSVNDSSPLPHTFAETIDRIEKIALQRFEQEAIEQKLYYHTQIHVQNVRRRSHQIFTLIAPALEAEATAQAKPINLERMALLLDLCAAAHDMVQRFEPNPQKHTARRRKPGASEIATIDQLLDDIHRVNQQLEQHDPHSDAKLTDAEIALIREAIQATICTFDLKEQAIYQPMLYDPNRSPSIVTRILALADIGALGMDGIEAFNQEGRLLFLEENPDVVPLLQNGTLNQLEQTNPALAENIRQRLLNRCRFQINFAKSRLARMTQELQGFPTATIPILIEKAFRYLTPQTVQAIEQITPTSDRTSLQDLLRFFQFEQYFDRARPG